ncbi:TIGR02391 family protein [Methanobacterium subterraneum]|uniref:TIGR02391 family protein n=1 Tax=Methanobacterium subterraneum TaxID=59277 RepID=A0A2H4VMS1_9EURY|nr:TIGR02391 family protein [Methanobacterium subterraneum]AUB59384.1 TIGR02391 family protein [Methanobacterium subterraneum]
MNDEITREKLNNTVNYYMENGDFETARNIIKSWGEKIDGFNINEELEKFDNGDYLPGFWPWIHQDIIKVSKQLFEDKHYAHSVESAFKEVNSRVKIIYKNKTGDEIDGYDLMMKAFKYNKNRNTGQITEWPIIQLTDLNSISDRNIQDGYRLVFAGSIQAFRNPKAHENQDITQKTAAHSIFVASKLMHRLDDSNY